MSHSMWKNWRMGSLPIFSLRRSDYVFSTLLVGGRQIKIKHHDVHLPGGRTGAIWFSGAAPLWTTNGHERRSCSAFNELHGMVSETKSDVDRVCCRPREW